MEEINVYTHICKLCNESFENNRKLVLHINKKHNMTSKDYYNKFYKQENEGICLNCGKETKYLNITEGYRKYCCRKCTDSDPIKQQKTKNTTFEKFGTDSVLRLANVREKSKISSQSIETRNKRSQTCLDKYGVDNPWKANSIIKKISDTKTKNGTRSSLEIYFENLLIKHNIEFDTNHYDNRYPYNCDFYLSETDTFIEINNFWHHNTHFFDSNNVNDIAILNTWKEKSKVIPQYKQAIYKWTIQDIEKRDCAIKNNLNYVVLWNKNDINTFIKNYIKR